ncbi:MAG TPA: hypothetical protein VMU94_02950 [Streptosporangiaceae bacterium]|nr:hypothetical protein [Streptosporangiaceae bacterium]
MTAIRHLASDDPVEEEKLTEWPDRGSGHQQPSGGPRTVGTLAGQRTNGQKRASRAVDGGGTTRRAA